MDEGRDHHPSTEPPRSLSFEKASSATLSRADGRTDGRTRVERSNSELTGWKIDFWGTASELGWGREKERAALMILTHCSAAVALVGTKNGGKMSLLPKD